MSSMPTRIDGDLFEAAKRAGRVNSRSAAQQLDHWARIGRELEAMMRIGLVSGPIPAVRTIGRILERRGVLDGRRRVRRPGGTCPPSPITPMSSTASTRWWA